MFMFLFQDSTKNGVDCRPKTRKKQHEKSKEEEDADHDGIYYSVHPGKRFEMIEMFVFISYFVCVFLLNDR